MADKVLRMFSRHIAPLLILITLVMAGARGYSLALTHSIIAERNSLSTTLLHCRSVLQPILQQKQETHAQPGSVVTDESRSLEPQTDPADPDTAYPDMAYPDTVYPDTVYTVQWQRFDPRARVRLLPGDDQMPGGAEIDDNANGVIDDAGELGATHSDDVCVVEASDEKPSTIQPSVVLQFGAFIPASLAELGTSPFPTRVLVSGQSAGLPWSFLIDLPSPLGQRD